MRTSAGLTWVLLFAACGGDGASEQELPGAASSGGMAPAGSEPAPGTTGSGDSASGDAVSGAAAPLGSEMPPTPGNPAPGAAGPGGGAALPGTCESLVAEHVPSGFDHVAPCSPVSYESNPPSGGSHYGVWAAYQGYDFAVPHGFLVHALEHGAVVFWYNCPEGCPDEVARARAFIEALPADPLCGTFGAPRRVILTPAPELATRWAASSWGFTLNAGCFDEAAMRAFYDEHYGNGRESLCNDGVIITQDMCPPG